MVAAAIWDVRKQARERAAASKARFEQIFKEQASTAAPPDSPPAALTVAAARPAPPVAPEIAAVPAGDRFLGPAETMIYGLLKTGMPDHEIFANVMLASVVSASGSGYQREQQIRRLSHYQIDFVVCDRDMRIVAAVEMETATGADAIGVRRFKADCLKAAGIRLVRIHAASPPRGDEIRALVGIDRPPPSAC
jgi:hypothetical protein